MVKEDMARQCKTRDLTKRGRKLISEKAFGKNTKVQALKVADDLIILAKEVYKKYKNIKEAKNLK